MSTKVIPGCRGRVDEASNTSHRQAAAFSVQGLLAYSVPNGSGDVFVVCVRSMQIVQTLSGHAAQVTCLLWHPPHVSDFHQHASHLYTADIKGYVVMWDVAEGIVERSLCLPGQRTARCMSLSANRQLLIVLASDHTSYVYDAQLSDPNPIPGAALDGNHSTQPGKQRQQHAFPPTALVFSRLDSRSTAAVAMGDRVRIISNVDALVNPHPQELHNYSNANHHQSTGSPWAKDVIFDSEDGLETVVDVCFSCAIPELLFLASRQWVSLYDWKLQLMLKEQVLWTTKRGAEFVSIFPVSLHSMDEDGRLLPHLYALTTDGRLTAWYITSMETFQSVSCDTRGERIPSKFVYSVCQSEMTSSEFAVIFTDGSIAYWRFLTDERCWSMLNYLDVPMQKPIAMCALSFTEHITSAPASVAQQRAPRDNDDATAGWSADNVEVSAREFGDRTVQQSLVVVALESGDLVVHNAMFNAPQRKFTVVHAGTTKTLLVSPHIHDMVWVATCRTIASNRHFLQVSLISARSGQLKTILRDPSPVPEPSILVSMATDATHTFLLLGFLSGAFEIWNAVTRSLLFVHNGNSIHHVAWGPLASRLDKGYGPFQLVVAMMEEGGGAQFFRVQHDRATRLKELLPMRAGGGTSVSHSCAVGDDLICVDSLAGASIVRGVGETTRWAPLQHVPKSSPVSIVPYIDASTSKYFAAIAFDDGTFGVWDIKTSKRIGFSSKIVKASDGRQVLSWLQGSLVVLTPSGSLCVLDVDCETVNASFITKSLRRPMQSIAFMKPNHAMYVRSKWEMSAVRGRDTPDGRASHDFPGWSLRLSQSSVISLTSSTSYLIHNVAQPLPCRGPLGQVIAPTIVTLIDELELYAETMLPRHIASKIQRAAERCSLEAAACLVAQFCGQVEKQHFWSLVRYWRHTWEKHADAVLEFTKSHTLNSDGIDPLDEAFLEQCTHDILCPPDPNTAPFGPLSPLFAPDRYSEALSPQDVLLMNRKCLIELRRFALNGFRVRNVDDGHARLVVSRELLALGDHAGACELLIDSNTELASFDGFATLAIAIAAAQTSTAPSAMFALTAKRAAAMLLAKGDVGGAAEKFALIGEHYEASLALQSQGMWNAAALVARLSPMTESCRSELLHRWATHCAQRGEGLVSARMLLALKSPRQALVILADCAHLTDVAGLFAVALARQYALLSETCLSVKVASPFRCSNTHTAPSETLGELLVSLLGDYENHLKAVGNVFCQQIVKSLIDGIQPALSASDGGARSPIGAVDGCE